MTNEELEEQTTYLLKSNADLTDKVHHLQYVIHEMEKTNAKLRQAIVLVAQAETEIDPNGRVF